jgi:predicted dehydrogenase
VSDLALAGAGLIASVHAVAAVHAGLHVTFVASRNAARADALAARVGARSCTYGELPAGADIVVVATPPGCHAAHALTAVEGRAAVLIEKPLASTLAEADALVAAAENGAVIGYGENLVYAPAVHRAIEQARGLGRLTHLEVRAEQSRPTWGDFLTAGWGGGALFDLGVHPLAVAMLLAGRDTVVEVTAALTGAGDHPTDEHAEVELRFASGLIGRVVASWRSADPMWAAEVASSLGTVRLELLPDLLLERDGTTVELPATATPDAPSLDALGYVNQLAAMNTAAAADRSPACGAAFGRAVLDIVCAAYASARTGSPEAVPFTGQRDRTPLQLWRPDSPGAAT